MSDSKNEEDEAPAKFTLLGITGGIWRTTPVSETPQLMLIDWRVFSVSMPGGNEATRHFVGWNLTEEEGRASSPIVEFDPVSSRGRTRTGRVYELRGKAGWNSDADYVWTNWRRLNGITDVLEVADISAEVTRWESPQ